MLIAQAATADSRPRMMPRVSVAILPTLCPAVAAGQVFGAGARTEFISGFGVRTFATVEARNRLLVDGTAAVDAGGPALRVRTTPVAIVYGLRSRLSLVAVLPFVDKQLSFPGEVARAMTLGAGGLGDALFLTKWRFYKRDQPLGTFQLTTELGVKAPTGAHDLEDADGRPLPPALRRGSGSWDPMANLIMTYVPAAGRGRCWPSRNSRHHAVSSGGPGHSARRCRQFKARGRPGSCNSSRLAAAPGSRPGR